MLFIAIRFDSKHVKQYKKKYNFIASNKNSALIYFGQWQKAFKKNCMNKFR